MVAIGSVARTPHPIAPDLARRPKAHPQKFLAQCDETYCALANAAGREKPSRMRFVSAAGVNLNNLLNSLLNWLALS